MAYYSPKHFYVPKTIPHSSPTAMMNQQMQFSRSKMGSFASLYNSTEKQIGNYSFNLNDEVGNGEFSKVYKGRDSLSRGEVAIKVIDLFLISDSIKQQLVNNEIKLLQTLEHENILKLLTTLQSSNNLYIITEFCDEDLNSQIRKSGLFQEDQALKIIGEVAAALKYMHSFGIIHRDIKPANILFANGKTKLADFGFATNKNAIQQQYKIGTPLFMAPEIFSLNSYNEKTDVWSLGICLYEMIFGKVPFFAATEDELIELLRKYSKEQQLEYDFAISKKLANLLEGMLAFDSRNRVDIDTLLSRLECGIIYENCATEATMMEEEMSCQMKREMKKLTPPRIPMLLVVGEKGSNQKYYFPSKKVNMTSNEGGNKVISKTSPHVNVGDMNLESCKMFQNAADQTQNMKLKYLFLKGAVVQYQQYLELKGKKFLDVYDRFFRFEEVLKSNSEEYLNEPLFKQVMNRNFFQNLNYYIVTVSYISDFLKGDDNGDSILRASMQNIRDICNIQITASNSNSLQTTPKK